MPQEQPSLRAVTQLVLGALNAAEVPHGLALDALLTLYRGLALKFPCCTPNAALNCQGLADELNAALATQQPASIQTH